MNISPTITTAITISEITTTAPAAQKTVFFSLRSMIWGRSWAISFCRNLCSNVLFDKIFGNLYQLN